ncbi:malonyl-CoA synthase [Pseudahrensia aquimaris]|uniref:Malonyl-CoA synthase n=1 Tax=Pseudahrensia aquimaris TaxID=744461 RepID=A0ABW3F8S7_9HYPH
MSNHLIDGLLANADPLATFAKLKNGTAYSYRSIFELSAQLANALVNCGVAKGDRVAVQAPKSVEAAMLYIACARMGAVFLPLNTAYTAQEVRYFLDDASAKLFICDPASSEALKPIAEECGSRLETLGVPGESKDSGSFFALAQTMQPTFENAACGPDDLAAILYTSGTTGRSKGAMLSHDNLLSNARALTDFWRFTSDDVLLHALPIFHTHGLFVALNVVMCSGASLIFLPAFNNDDVIDALPAATSMMGVPTFYTRLLNDDRFSADLVSHIRLFVSGSAPLLAETHVQFEQRTGMRILERYGMTETNMNTSNPYDGERRAGTVGFPLPGTQLRIADPDTGQELPQGEVGVIEVKGPNVFSGYWNMPEKTAEEFRKDGFFITGDLGKIDKENYVHIVGRAKDLIISGGYNIYPKEIELLLDDQPGVLESAVIGVAHPDFGEGVVAVIVPSDPDFDPAKTLETIKSQIARFKQPKHIEVLKELPRNTMGKVQKNVLRENLKGVFNA